jgi:division protein 1
LCGHGGTVKTLQVEAHLCATGATDGAVRLWDLRRVDGDAETSEWDLSDVLEEMDEDGDCTGTSTGDSVVVDRPRTAPNGTRPRSRTPKKETPGSCIRVLEGHSKAVTALYFENDTLVRPFHPLSDRQPLKKKPLHTTR